MNRVCINIDIPDKYYNKAKYIFSTCSMAWGIPLKISRGLSYSEDADIFYSRNAKYIQWDNHIIIPFDEQLYDTKTECDVITKDGYSLWVRSSEKVNIDLVASTFRLLNLTDESQINNNARDDKGVFPTSALPDNRKKISKIPIVEDHINLLLEKLLQNNPNLKESIIPRWPGGKKHVISITHDTDAVNLGSPKELLTNSAKFVIRREKVFFDMFRDGLKYINKPSDNPLFGFSGWQDYESLNNYKSCFYLFVKPKKEKTHLNDCKSNVFSEKIDWRILRELAENNWEFGVHPSINSKNNIDEFIYAKLLIEQKLGINIFGIRHHYWALNWFDPYVTFRKHVNAGFRYDTSIALKDEPGFRAGTCLPYQPFDPKRDKPLNYYELPTCLMDGHIIDSRVATQNTICLGKKIIDTVNKRGGVAVLDWHTETYCSDYVYKDHLKILNSILQEAFHDSETWFATPWEVIKWWHAKSSIILEDEHV